MNNLNKNVNYEIIVKSINDIFSNVDKYINKIIFDKYKIINRKSKLSFTDTVIYALEYTQNNKTKSDIVNKFNKNNNTKISRTTFFEKDSKIPILFWFTIYNKLISVYNKYFVDKQKKSIIAVDGTYNNINIKNIKGYLETSLNMGFFDVTNDIPIELIFKGEESKNKEIESLKNYLVKNKNYFNNAIFVLDRGYSSYNFIKFCVDNNIKYVIRFKNNCNNIPKNNRVIKFTNFISEVVKNDNIDTHLINNKKFSSVTLKTENEYTLITNLDSNIYSDDKIKEI